MLKFLEQGKPHMAEPESLAVENHHNSGDLSSLFLDDQLEESEDTGEEVEERHLRRRPLTKSEHNNSSSL